MPYGQGDFRANIGVLNVDNHPALMAKPNLLTKNLNLGLLGMAFDLEQDRTETRQKMARIEQKLDLILSLLQDRVQPLNVDEP
jgi:hypothetical protein